MEVSNSHQRISEMLGDMKPNDYTFNAVYKFLQCLKPYLRHIHLFQPLNDLLAFTDSQGNECVSDRITPLYEGDGIYVRAIVNKSRFIKIKQLAVSDSVVNGGIKGDMSYKTREYCFIVLSQEESMLMRWEVCYRFTVPVTCPPELMPVCKTFHPIRSVFSFLDSNKLKAIAATRDGEAELARDIFTGLQAMILEDIKAKEHKIDNFKNFGQWLKEFMPTRGT
jgi:hypothetical protein